MDITVFTPTYNRAYTLPRLFESLKNQTCFNFEWIVVDDGSTDNTEGYFNSISTENSVFSVKYVKVKNGGKHRAINKGVSIANGRLFFIVDSDDYLPSNSIESILSYEKMIPNSEIKDYCGIAGLKANENNKSIGNTFDGEIVSCTYLEGPSLGITGDKAEVYYTDILKKYPFPEFDNEKFIPESVVWNVIAENGYKLLYFNKGIYFCEYLEDGLTKSGNSKYLNNPKGYGLYLAQSIQYGKLTKIKKWNALFDYYRMFNEKMSFSEMADNLKINKSEFYFRMLGMRLYYKIYNK